MEFANFQNSRCRVRFSDTDTDFVCHRVLPQKQRSQATRCVAVPFVGYVVKNGTTLACADGIFSN